jgi:hypothetical protein
MFIVTARPKDRRTPQGCNVKGCVRNRCGHYAPLGLRTFWVAIPINIEPLRGSALSDGDQSQYAQIRSGLRHFLPHIATKPLVFCGIAKTRTR